MQLNGSHIFKAPRERVWAMLMDTDSLAKMVPGVITLEQTGEYKYKALLGVKLGPVNASFAGNLELDDIEVPHRFTMKVQQNSKVGNASAVIGIVLNAVTHDQTEVIFDGSVKLSGMLASMGQRLIGSVANNLSSQFFNNLEKQMQQA